MIIAFIALVAAATQPSSSVESRREGMLQDCASIKSAEDRFLFALFWQQGADGKRVYDSLIIPHGTLADRLGRTEFSHANFTTAPLPPGKDGKRSETFLFVTDGDRPGTKNVQYTLSGATEQGTLREMEFELHIGSELVKGICRKSRPAAADSDELK